MATKPNGNELFGNLPISVVAVGGTLAMAMAAAIILSFLPEYSEDIMTLFDSGPGGAAPAVAIPATDEQQAATTVNGIEASPLPVFRFAMLYWKTRSAHIYYYCKDMANIDPRDQTVLAHASEINETEPTARIDIEAFDDPTGAELPDRVREIFEAHDVAQQPLFVVTTAWNRPIFSGELSEEQIDAMFDSPLRTKTAQLLAGGAGCVFVVVAGSDEKANMQAIENIESVVEALHAGDIKIPNQGNVPIRCEVMTVDRKDQAEHWFVTSLLATEENLADKSFDAIPIAFPVYGRMQSLPPLAGVDISPTSVKFTIQMLGERCCLTKEIPLRGCDIPIRWNWQQTAEKLGNETPDHDPLETE